MDQFFHDASISRPREQFVIRIAATSFLRSVRVAMRFARVIDRRFFTDRIRGVFGREMCLGARNESFERRPTEGERRRCQVIDFAIGERNLTRR